MSETIVGYNKENKTHQKRSPSRFRLSAPRAREADEQKALIRYAAVKARQDARWGMLFSIPNGMRASSIHQAVLAKKTGLKRGVPDLFLPVPTQDWHGLFVELKRSGGKASDLSADQMDWLQRLHDLGYRAVVAFGWREAAEEIHHYLGTAHA